MKEKIKLYFPLILLIGALFLVRFPYVAIIISLVGMILGFIFSRKNIRILIVTIIVGISCIITCSVILYKKYEELKDKYEGINILLGTWLYNEYGGTYVFNEDNTYTQYSNENKEDNYCVGSYKYSYGGVSNDGVVIREDDNFYYYNLDLQEDYCIISGIENYDKYKKGMVFALSKNELPNILINKESENMFEFKKIEE